MFLSLRRKRKEASPAEIYRRAVRSVALLEGVTEDGASVEATGFMVGPGMILTCDHFAAGAKAVRATFPRQDDQGGWIACRDYYTSEKKVPCTTAARDSGKDLALLWSGDAIGGSLPLASERPSPGDPLVIVGCGDHIPWSLYRTSSQQYGRIKHTFKNGPEIDVDVVVAAGVAGKGDSGSPVFNTRGEVVGIYCAGCPRSLWAVATAEIRCFLRLIN